MLLALTSHSQHSEASYHNMTIGRIPSVEGGIQPTIFDAKADILTATAADTPARLAVGANDTVLTADSSTATGLKWAAVSAGGMTLISETAASANSSISFSSISGSYKQLLLTWGGIRHSETGSEFSIRFNNDSNNNYYTNGPAFASNRYVQMNGLTSSSIRGQNSPQDVFPFGKNANNAGASTDIFGWLVVDNYASTTKTKTFNVSSNYYNLASDLYFAMNLVGFYNSTSAITSLDIVRLSGSATITNQNNTTIRLYGVS